MGPIFQGINECLFSQLKYFIKKVPVNERAQFLKTELGSDGRFDCTDFSSFEAHFMDFIIYAIEFPFYFWATSQIPYFDWFYEELYTLTEINTCIFRDFVVYSMSRASGEMNTSSGNGWVNMIIFTYISRIKRALEARAKFEGDDGICKVFPEASFPTTKDYDDLGWTCKLITNNGFSTASFCGIVADPEDLINVCDIKAYLADFGWTRQQYMKANNTTIMALIRAKGYSAIYQYPGCPIIDALGHYALRITNSGVVKRKMLKMYKNNQLADSRYKNSQFQAIFDHLLDKIPERKDTPPNTRLLVEKLFGITDSKQKEIELYLDGLNSIQNLDIDIEVPELWRYAFDTYVNNCPITSVQQQFDELMQYLQSINLV